MSARTRSDADTFWRMLAFLGNALIFLLMGVQIHPLDGNRSSVYSSPTTAVQRVEATPHVLRMPTTDEWQKLLGFNRCGVSQPVQRAGAEKTRAGLAVYPQRPFRRRVWADHAPFWLPLPNGSFGDIFRELQRRSPGRYQPLHIRTLIPRNAENPSLSGSQTVEEQWQAEAIRGPLPSPVSAEDPPEYPDHCQLIKPPG